MRISGKLLAVVVAGGVLSGGWLHANEVRIPINAKGMGMLTSPLGVSVTTESQIIGGGILHGTTTADLEITGENASGVLSFDGTLVLTTKQGTLTLEIFDGFYDSVSGEFNNNSVVLDGTGRFAGASGGLYFHGFIFSDGTFIDDEISGAIYVKVP